MLHGEESKQEKATDGFSDFKVKLWTYQGEMGALIPLLQSAQETYGYVPESAIDHISQIVGIPSAEIYGVVTFYSQFRLRPTGKNIIKICDGTACHVNASSLMIKTIENELKVANNETTDDGLFTLQKVACLGCCSLSPVVMINEETYGRLTPKKVQQLLKEYRERSQEEQSLPAEGGRG
jgi:NADH-quinone oxidoreductase subunit E